MNIIPTVLVRNEENYIAAVLRPLLAVFGRVLLGDTGSSDSTPDIAAALTGVEVLHFGVVSAAAFTECRRELGRQVAVRGADWQFLCDGDELYNVTTLRSIADAEPPATLQAGYTNMLTLDVDDDGQLYEMQDNFSRLAVMPALTAWRGDYPFDIPAVFERGVGFYYYALPAGYRYHALHLHRLQRSGRDGEVLLRPQKRKQFSMIDKPHIARTVPFDLAAWCAQ